MVDEIALLSFPLILGDVRIIAGDLIDSVVAFRPLNLML